MPGLRGADVGRDWATLRSRFHEIATDCLGQAASLPIPIEGHRVSLAPGHAWHDLDGAQLGDEPWHGRQKLERTCTTDDTDERWHVRNSWWSRTLKTEVMIAWRGQPGDPDFKVEAVKSRPHAVALDGLYRWHMQQGTLDAGLKAWSLEAELRALEMLAGFVSPHAFSLYMLCGTFAESSPRSRAVYFFRKGRPTIVMLNSEDGNLHPSVALCLHPLAYYEGTWAGGMCPTDDVIAHLALMRADEPLLWRKAQQHPIDRLEAGL